MYMIVVSGLVEVQNGKSLLCDPPLRPPYALHPVYLSVCLSVPCPVFTRKRKIMQRSNLEERLPT